MSFKDKTIRINDWTGRTLFIGDYDDPKVDEVLDANRCNVCEQDSGEYIEREDCEVCDGTGYAGDFEVSWIDEDDKEGCNVYEYINY